MKTRMRVHTGEACGSTQIIADGVTIPEFVPVMIPNTRQVVGRAGEFRTINNGIYATLDVSNDALGLSPAISVKIRDSVIENGIRRIENCELKAIGLVLSSETDTWPIEMD